MGLVRAGCVGRVGEFLSFGLFVEAPSIVIAQATLAAAAVPALAIAAVVPAAGLGVLAEEATTKTTKSTQAAGDLASTASSTGTEELLVAQDTGEQQGELADDEGLDHHEDQTADDEWFQGQELDGQQFEHGHELL